MGKVGRNEKNVTLTSENSMAISYKIKHTNLIVPSNLFHTYLPKKNEAHVQRPIMLFMAALLINTQKLKTKNN